MGTVFQALCREIVVQKEVLFTCEFRGRSMMQNAMSSTFETKNLVRSEGRLIDDRVREISGIFIDESMNDPGTSSSVRVVVVDDRAMVREGIEQQPDLLVVAHSASISSAKELQVKADLIVADIDAPDPLYGDVIVATGRLFPDVRLLALSMVRHPAKVQHALDMGADGYLLKTARAADLLTGIRSLGRGEPYLQPLLGVELARWSQGDGSSFDLSVKEENVLQMLALGNTNPEIAQYLGVSLRTVETHRSRIYHKLGLKTRAELVRYARNVGLLAETPR
jgi:two-component system, NarL family, response regulator NreC